MTPQQFAAAHDRYLTPPDDDPPMTECGECGGNGTLTDEQGNTEKCHVCNGEGEVQVEPDEPDYPEPDDAEDDAKNWGGIDEE